MLSGLNEEMVIRVALSLGVDRYLTKPFNESAVLAALDDVAASREIAA
jgi:YesN/AraC family two-component response regulator